MRLGRVHRASAVFCVSPPPLLERSRFRRSGRWRPTRSSSTWPSRAWARARRTSTSLGIYVAGERLAARAASPATRRQYASIYRTFGDWLRGELGHPPTTADLTADAIAAVARHLETSGGRGGGPASPATRRIYVNMVRALARDAGLAEEADRVRALRDYCQAKVPDHALHQVRHGA